jgi:hypothetical protein
MPIRLDQILTHDNTEECVACRSRDFTAEIIVPAVAAWEASENLPRLSLAIHGAAGLLGVMLADGVSRDQIDEALSRLLDEIEAEVAEEGALSGPALGNA